MARAFPPPPLADIMAGAFTDPVDFGDGEMPGDARSFYRDAWRSDLIRAFPQRPDHQGWDLTTMSLMERAGYFVTFSRLPRAHPARSFGVWDLEWRVIDDPLMMRLVGSPLQAILRRASMATLHQERGEIVMEDSTPELTRHLPIWMHAKGRVLVTGLGMGCVVRGLRLNRAVSAIDVVELDPRIIAEFGPEFAHDPRVTIHRGDAETIAWPEGTRWDHAWHDLWVDGDNLNVLHLRLFERYGGMVGRQGAWGMPRQVKDGLRRVYARMGMDARRFHLF